MNKFLILIFSLILMSACKQKGSDSSGQENNAANEQSEMNAQSGVNEPEKVVNPLVLPDPCSLLSKTEIASLFRVAEKDISFKPGNKSQGQDYSISCFITWEKDGGSQGVLLQVMKNPLYGEFDEWASSYIEVLGTKGEISFPDNVAHVYESVNGLGDAAVVNSDLGKLYWRQGDDLVFGIIFRNGTSSNSIKKTGKQLGTIVIENLK